MAWNLDKWTRENRERRRWSQDILAEKSNVTKSYISKIENAREPIEVSRDVLDDLATAFGLSRYEAYKAADYSEDMPDTVLLFHLPKGSRIPIQITDNEIISATEKLVRAKLQTDS